MVCEGHSQHKDLSYGNQRWQMLQVVFDGGQLVQQVQAQGFNPIAESIQSR